MRFTVTATVEYNVDVDGEVAEELVNYCNEHECDLDEALWQKQRTDTDFNLYDNPNCTVDESDFFTDSIEYEGMSDYDDIDEFIKSTAENYDIKHKQVADIIGEDWDEDEDEDEDDDE